MRKYYSKILSFFLIFIFIANTINIVPVVSAQTVLPGFSSNQTYCPLLLKGLLLDRNDPLKTEFIVDTGTTKLKPEDVEPQSKVLMEYFITSLTFSSKDLWVNLSPKEPNRIIPLELAKTHMGQDMLEQDLYLKKMTSGLLDPESDSGRKFWDKIYKIAYAKYDKTEIPVDILSKVWIVPDYAQINEQGGRVFVTEAKLKVMTEVDDRSPIVSSILKEIIIPKIEAEVNESKDFVKVRQIYYSFILANWYKKLLNNTILGKQYFDQRKVNGVDTASDDKEKIYKNYLDLFKGSNIIREEYDPNTQELVAKKYTTGGLIFEDLAMKADSKSKISVVGEAVRVKGGMVRAIEKSRKSAFAELLSAKGFEFTETMLNWFNEKHGLIYQTNNSDNGKARVIMPRFMDAVFSMAKKHPGTKIVFLRGWSDSIYSMAKAMAESNPELADPKSIFRAWATISNRNQVFYNTVQGAYFLKYLHDIGVLTEDTKELLLVDTDTMLDGISTDHLIYLTLFNAKVIAKANELFNLNLKVFNSSNDGPWVEMLYMKVGNDPHFTDYGVDVKDYKKRMRVFTYDEVAPSDRLKTDISGRFFIIDTFIKIENITGEMTAQGQIYTAPYGKSADSTSEQLRLEYLAEIAGLLCGTLDYMDTNGFEDQEVEQRLFRVFGQYLDWVKGKGPLVKDEFGIFPDTEQNLPGDNKSNDKAMLSLVIERKFVREHWNWFKNMFTEYSKDEILSAQGKKLLTLDLNNLSERQVFSLYRLMSYFRNIPNMSKQEIIEKFPQAYFRDMDGRIKKLRQIELEMVSGCPNLCLFCPFQHGAKLKSMPFPLLIMAVRKGIKIKSSVFNYEPLYYEDPSGALFADVMKLTDLDGIITHGVVEGYEDLAVRNLERINFYAKTLNKFYVNLSVHPMDVDLLRLKKQHASVAEIEEYYFNKFKIIIEKLRNRCEVISVGMLEPHEELSSIYPEWLAINEKILKRIEIFAQDQGQPKLVVTHNPKMVLSSKYYNNILDPYTKRTFSVQGRNSHRGFLPRFVMSAKGKIEVVMGPKYIFAKDLPKNLSSNLKANILSHLWSYNDDQFSYYAIVKFWNKDFLKQWHQWFYLYHNSTFEGRPFDQNLSELQEKLWQMLIEYGLPFYLPLDRLWDDKGELKQIVPTVKRVFVLEALKPVNDPAQLVQEQRAFVVENLAWIRDTVFKEYEKIGILSEEGKRVLTLSESVLSDAEVTEMHQLITYFKNIPDMTGQEVMDQFPQKYFLQIDEKFWDYINRNPVLFIDGCPNMCLFCAIQRFTNNPVSMPYPLAVMLAKLKRSDFNSIEFEALYYNDPSGAGIGDIYKLMDLSGMIIHDYQGVDKELAARNIRSFMKWFPKGNITISMHPADVRLLTMIKHKTAWNDIVDYYFNRLKDLLGILKVFEGGIYIAQRVLPRNIEFRYRDLWNNILFAIIQMLPDSEEYKSFPKIFILDRGEISILSPRMVSFIEKENKIQAKKFYIDGKNFIRNNFTEAHRSNFFIVSPNAQLWARFDPNHVYIEELESTGLQLMGRDFQVILNVMGNEKFYIEFFKAAVETEAFPEYAHILKRLIQLMGYVDTLSDEESKEVFNFLRKKKIPVPVHSSLSVFQHEKQGKKPVIYPKYKIVKLGTLLKSEDSAQLSPIQSQSPGGIRFDETQMKVENTGEGIDFRGEWERQFDDKVIQGFMPVVYSTSLIKDLSAVWNQ
ncbi:MAG: hypothetical protein HQL25_02365 [Candidatus Omnitrophica bacterium]|nr:hypothetical protein [Candidatus Omnitrophota bacterium]